MRQPSQRWLARRWLGCLALAGLLAVGACSGGSGGKADGGGDVGGGADIVVSAQTCQGIRACLWACTTGMQACVDNCISKATPAEQALYQTLAACTTAAGCQTGDFTCGCDQQCFGASACLTETEACVAGAVADNVCDELCH